MATNDPPLNKPGEKFPWRKEIVTTVFWIGEKPTANNPVPNRSSSWDANWTKNYGGVDKPEKTHPHPFISAELSPPPKPHIFPLPSQHKTPPAHRAPPRRRA